MIVKFNHFYNNRHYAVVAALNKKNEIKSMTVYLIHRNGSIVRRKFLDITHALSKILHEKITREIYSQASHAQEVTGK